MPANAYLRALYLRALALALPLFVSLSASGLPSDRNQAIEIQSEEALRIEPKGLTEYKGDVLIVQGSMEIRADQVNVYNNENRVLKIVCIGRPAQFQQKPKEDAPLVIARGGTITYSLEQDIIILSDGASLIQEDATLTGERIEYDLKKEIIRAKGSNGDRIRMVIPPNQQPEAF